MWSSSAHVLPNPCPAAMREPLERDQAGLCDMVTTWGWHQSCQSPGEVELGASPSLPAPSSAQPHLTGHPGDNRDPDERGAVGSRTRCPPVLLLHPSPVPAICSPQPARWGSHPLALLPACTGPAKSRPASPVICNEPAGSRHSINVLRQGLPFASKVPNSRGVGVVLTFMCYL